MSNRSSSAVLERPTDGSSDILYIIENGVSRELNIGNNGKNTYKEITRYFDEHQIKLRRVKQIDGCLLYRGLAEDGTGFTDDYFLSHHVNGQKVLVQVPPGFVDYIQSPWKSILCD